jgi:hypothetical protein
MRKLITAGTVLLILSACSDNSVSDDEKIVQACWKKFEHNQDALMTDVKCSNFAVWGRLGQVDNNRACGYRDLYNETRNNLNLDDLSKKDKAYMENTFSCAKKYKVYFDNDPELKKNWDLSRTGRDEIFPALDADKKCNTPATRQRLRFIAAYDREPGEGFCFPSNNN